MQALFWWIKIKLQTNPLLEIKVVDSVYVTFL